MIRKRSSSFFFPLLVGLLYLFFYVPLIVLVLYSFHPHGKMLSWSLLTTEWYNRLWEMSEVWDALYNSLIVASFSVILCLSMTSLFIFYGRRNFVGRSIPLFYVNLGIPEIVLAVGLMSMFYFLGVPLSLVTLIAAHTVLGLGYVVPIIYDRYIELDEKYQEASLDLGATPWQTFTWVVLPLLYPALLTSALLVFIISFDDFVLSFFCSSGSTQTLPMYIFALIRAGGSPVVNALSTVLLCGSTLIVSLFLFLQNKREG